MKVLTSLPYYVKLTCILLIIVILSYSTIILENIFVPMFLGLLVSFLLVPVCNFFEQRCKIPRAFSAILVIVLFAIVVFSIFIIVGSEFSGLQDDLPAFKKQLEDSVSLVQEWIYQKFGVAQSHQLNLLEKGISSSLQTSTSIIGGIFSSISTMVMFVFFSLLYAIFLLIYRRHLVQFLIMSFGEKQKSKVLEIIMQVRMMVKQYLLGLLLQMACVAVLSLIAFSILGLKYKFVLALITALLNVVPYIGIFISLIIASLITLATATPSTVLFVLIAYVIIHAIDGNFIMPKIVGSKVKLNSLTVVIGLVIGEMVWGISGMFLAIPTLAVLKIIFDKIDGLKPWGFLLGEEVSSKKNKSVTEEDKADEQ